MLNLTCQHDLPPQRLRCCRSAGGNAELLEQLNERGPLGLREPTRCQIHGRLVNGEYLGRLLFARRGQPNDASPSVARVGLARDQVARLESIHSGGDRPTGELDAPANLIDRLRSLVKKHLHDREIRQPHLGRLNALDRQALKRPVRLHHHEPQMRARNVGGLLSCRGAFHSPYILTSRYVMSSHIERQSRRATGSSLGKDEAPRLVQVFPQQTDSKREGRYYTVSRGTGRDNLEPKPLRRRTLR